jgi:hypothetical protein
MEHLPPATLASLIVEQFARAHPGALDAQLRADLTVRIETAIRTAATHERDACVSLCRERAALWAGTSPSPALPEARSRENEATVIADALEARQG